MPYSPRVAKKRKAEGPYTMDLIVARVEARRREMKLTAKAVYTELGLQQWDWSRRINQITPFTVDELSRLCVLLEGGTGFPFIDTTASDIIDRARSAPAPPNHDRR